MTTSSAVRPLMPQATAVWLIENTDLTFEQIARSCGFYVLEIQTLADTDPAYRIQGISPLVSGQLTPEELDRCSQDPEATLCFYPLRETSPMRALKGGHYVPRIRRSDRPDGIAWVLRHHPELTDYQISRLLHTTTKTIQAVRDRTHPNSVNIKPRHPVALSLCSQEALDHLVSKAALDQKNAKQAKDG